MLHHYINYCLSALKKRVKFIQLGIIGDYYLIDMIIMFADNNGLRDIKITAIVTLCYILTNVRTNQLDIVVNLIHYSTEYPLGI